MGGCAQVTTQNHTIICKELQNLQTRVFRKVMKPCLKDIKDDNTIHSTICLFFQDTHPESEKLIATSLALNTLF